MPQRRQGIQSIRSPHNPSRNSLAHEETRCKKRQRETNLLLCGRGMTYMVGRCTYFQLCKRTHTRQCSRPASTLFSEYRRAHKAPLHICLFTSSVPAANFALQSSFLSFSARRRKLRDCSSAVSGKRVTRGPHHSDGDSQCRAHEGVPEHSTTLRTLLTRFWLH